MANNRRELLTTAAVVTFSGGLMMVGSANAADLAVKAPMAAPLPVSTWSGWYIGANVGAARLNETASNNSSVSGGSAPCAYYATGSSCATSDTRIVGGVELGYNWQDRYYVYGVAADWMWTGLKHTTTHGSFFSFSTHQAKVDWLASFRGKAGMALDNNFIYLTGGLALAQLKSSTTWVDDSGTDANSYGALNKVQVGWVAGVGFEHKFTPQWSGKTEFLYYDLGRATASTSAGYSTEFTHEIFVSRVGLNYHF